ncbi:ABC transporter ATP-binding protein [Methanosarcina acetivorans]|uniref:Cobalamin import ATP-binding protein BtuD n=1 Tax=Methanosarcina acetivorans (strain ATCC 35395 / DSM 2834 / JCM 12185 / C2A) TaxID=188937 RepID=Q8TM90_METAC|nr:ABC transporter ATP-binding protein [Methanosarcina acetivorans]AAM06154.1 iron(III) ABC transporter, ATP-binding protein [Methanosarcina acetivorans C2A]
MKLSLDGVTLSYASVTVLHGISMEFCEPGVVGIIGPNGAGKSTLLRCINNVLTPKSGRICLDEQKTYDMDAAEIARNFGYVPQEFPITFQATVFDTVLMGRRPFSSWRVSRNDVEIAAGAVKMLNLEQVALRYHSELSGGQQQRVMIARALAQNSRVLLLDEPTSKLDIRHQLEVMDIIRALVDKRGLLSILVIHDLNLASRYADKLIMLKDGKIYAAGDPVSVLTQKNIRAVYGVEAAVVLEDNLPHIIPKRPV